ncbi:MAG: xanthine dehydrogenase family protein molybdopterin-binding subunit, partial [Actinomycetota bacterium]
MAVLRSPMAHAKIAHIDVSPALKRPHVVAAFSAKELGELNGTVPCVWPVTDDIQMPPFHALAVDKVRHVGDCVAVVIANTKYAAADALDAIEVDYEPLPAVIDMEAALKQGSVAEHDAADGSLGTNRCYDFPLKPTGDGSFEAAVKAAGDDAVVVKRRFINQRIIAGFMEPRAVVASPMGMSNEMTVWSATQIPHVLRVLLALVTGLPENSLRIVAPDVGGGFGGKLQCYREEVLAVQIARHLGRPVKWVETRSEDMVSTHHGRDQIQDIQIAATKDGKLIGMKVDLLANMGAYLQIITPGIPLLGMFMFPAIYKMDAYEFFCTGVFTNTTPTDAIRGAGRPEATYAIERIMDELAAELGMDPLKLREMNWIKTTEFPYTTVAGLAYDSGNYEAATERALELFGYDELRAE